MSVKTKIAEILAQGPKTVPQLAAEIPAHPQTVRVALWDLKADGQAFKSRREVPGIRASSYLWEASCFPTS